MIGKFLIFCAALMAIADANSALLCEKNLATSPTTCSSRTVNNLVNFNRVYGCSGGSLGVTEFEVYGGCGPNAGSGGYDNPVVQTPTGVQLAVNAAGPYCYCQIKSINGGANVASSPRWVFFNYRASADGCAFDCAYFCAFNAKDTPAFRSALFQALQ